MLNVAEELFARRFFALIFDQNYPMKQLCYFLAVLVIGGCTAPQKEYIVKVSLLKLTPEFMYNREMVYDVIFDSEELEIDSVKNKSRQLFLKGIDQLKNKKNAASAADILRKSILVFPEAKTYYELGNALLEMGGSNLKEADDAYDVAQYLQFKPAADITYKKACVLNRKNKGGENDEVVIGQIFWAFENGFSDTVKLYSDPYLSSVRGTEKFRKMMLNVKANKMTGSTGNAFSVFSGSFVNLGQPFSVGPEEVDMDNYRQQSINYNFAQFIPEMENTSFGRDVSHDFFYVGKVAETPVYTALIFSSISFWGAEMQPVVTKLVTYDASGKLIDERIFAAQFSAEKIKTGKIENNELVLEDYRRVWAKPITEVPFDKNSVEKFELVATAKFRLDDGGKIQEVSVPANYSDSSVFAKQ